MNSQKLSEREIEMERFLREEVRPFLDERADAEYFTESPNPVPNEEMQLLSSLDELLDNKLGGK